MKSMAPSLARIEALCAALDHPERSVPGIHVTGTNGKTSTARIASSLLTATGLSVGTYTSPHLESVRERITLDGTPITEDGFGETFDHLAPFIEHVEAETGEGLTYFEILTAMFFLWAVEAPVDAVVVEVGLGGTWDATNVMDAPVAVITNIGLDHTGILGTDRATIAKEKAGIIKSGATVVTAETFGDAASIIEDRSRSMGASLRRLGQDFDLISDSIAVGGRYLSVHRDGSDLEDLFLPLHGGHQAKNATLAIEAVAAFLPATTLEHAVIAEGLAKAQVPGRLETLPGPDGNVILDVAHNPDGMSATVTSLVETFAFESARFVLGILADKDLPGILRELARVPCTLVATEASSERSYPAVEIARAAQALGLECTAVPDVAAAIATASADRTEAEIVCVTGSHYVVGEARSHLRSPI